MPKPKKRSRADAAESSEARSKKLYSAHLAEDLRNELRGWPKPDRARGGQTDPAKAETSDIEHHRVCGQLRLQTKLSVRL